MMVQLDAIIQQNTLSNRADDCKLLVSGLSSMGKLSTC